MVKIIKMASAAFALVLAVRPDKNNDEKVDCLKAEAEGCGGLGMRDPTCCTTSNGYFLRCKLSADGGKGQCVANGAVPTATVDNAPVAGENFHIGF